MTQIRRIYTTSSARRSIRDVRLNPRSKPVAFYYRRRGFITEKKIRFLQQVVDRLIALQLDFSLRRSAGNNQNGRPTVRSFFRKTHELVLTHAWKILARIFELVRNIVLNLLIRSRVKRVVRRAVLGIIFITNHIFRSFRSADN